MAKAKNTNFDSNKFEKDIRIQKELKKINKLFKDLDKDKKKIMENVVQNAAFMAVELQDLQEHIHINGTTVEYQNGQNQWGVKKSPEFENYTSMMKTFITAMNSLTALLPKDVGIKIRDDGFDDFMSKK